MTTRDRVEAIFRDVFQDPTLAIHEEMTASSIPSWDSLNHINLVVALEGEFKVQFRSEEVMVLANVGDLLKLLATYGFKD